MTAITLNNISKSFGTKLLFENVTATFNAGAKYGLTGPNGSGKTTLLKIIMKMVEPLTGTVSLPDRVGILRQNIEDYHDITVVMRSSWATSGCGMTSRKSATPLYDVEMTDQVGMRLGDLGGNHRRKNGTTLPNRMPEMLLSGMGIQA